MSDYFKFSLISSSLKESNKLSPMLIPSISKSLISLALVHDWKLNVKIKIIKILSKSGE